MTNTLTTRPAAPVLTTRPAPVALALNVLRDLYAKFVIVLMLALYGTANAQGTPEAMQREFDSHALTFCKYVDILPKSKWVTLGALVFFLIGICLMIFGGRGGNVYLARALGVIVIVPSALAMASAFGIAC